jgi:cell shape-determining protein MreC
MNTFGRLLTVLLILVASGAIAKAQLPTPIIVQAASTNAAPVTKPVTETSDSIIAAIKTLQELKTANEETLKKQQATLERLDELQQAAQQLKIFANRG